MLYEVITIDGPSDTMTFGLTGDNDGIEFKQDLDQFQVLACNRLPIRSDRDLRAEY